jgi:hypothetical protein
VVSFTARLLYPRGKSPRYPFDRRLGGPRDGLDDMEKRKYSTLPRNVTREQTYSKHVTSKSQGLNVCDDRIKKRRVII